MTAVKLPALDLHESLPCEAAPGRRGGETAARCLAVTHVHRRADLAHDVDDLVDGDLELDAGEGELDTGERDGRPGRVAEDAGKLDEPAQRIADEAERPLKRERRGVADLRGGAPEHLRGGAGGHRGRRPGLGLAAALGARERRPFGYDGAYEAGDSQ